CTHALTERTADQDAIQDDLQSPETIAEDQRPGQAQEFHRPARRRVLHRPFLVAHAPLPAIRIIISPDTSGPIRVRIFLTFAAESGQTGKSAHGFQKVLWKCMRHLSYRCHRACRPETVARTFSLPWLLWFRCAPGTGGAYVHDSDSAHPSDRHH